MGADARAQSVRSGAEITNSIACVPAVEIGEEGIKPVASVRPAAARAVRTRPIANARGVGTVASAGTTQARL